MYGIGQKVAALTHDSFGVRHEGRDIGEDAEATPYSIESMSGSFDPLDAVAETITGRQGTVHNLNNGTLVKIADYGFDQDPTG